MLSRMYEEDDMEGACETQEKNCVSFVKGHVISEKRLIGQDFENVFRDTDNDIYT